VHGKPGTKAELAALDWAIAISEVEQPTMAKLLSSLRLKLCQPFRPRPDLPDVRAIEAALGGPSVAWTPAFIGAWGRKALAAGATVEDAKVIGPWLRAQPWGRDMTVDRVLAGWPSYLARARLAQGAPGDAPRKDWIPDPA
jgi:hypothetical protein